MTKAEDKAAAEAAEAHPHETEAQREAREAKAHPHETKAVREAREAREASERGTHPEGDQRGFHNRDERGEYGAGWRPSQASRKLHDALVEFKRTVSGLSQKDRTALDEIERLSEEAFNDANRQNSAIFSGDPGRAGKEQAEADAQAQARVANRGGN